MMNRHTHAAVLLASGIGLLLLATDLAAAASLGGPLLAPSAKSCGGICASKFGAKGDGVTDDTLAIQSAIDSAPAGATVVVPPGTFLVHGLRITQPEITLEVAGTLKLSSPIMITGNAVTVRATTVEAPNGFVVIQGAHDRVQVQSLEGINKAADGIVINGQSARVDFRLIQNCRTGILVGAWFAAIEGGEIALSTTGIKFANSHGSIVHVNQFRHTANKTGNGTTGLLFDAMAGGQAAENRVTFGAIWGFEYGIRFSSSTAGLMEGNLLMGAVYTCAVGIQLDPNGRHGFTTFIGVSDNVNTGTDLSDNGYHNLWQFYYIREGYYSLAPTSFLWNMQVNKMTQIKEIGVGDGTTGVAKILSGQGNPEGVVAAPLGSLYLRTDGGSSATPNLYVKDVGTGTTGWTSK